MLSSDLESSDGAPTGDNLDRILYALEEQTVCVERSVNSACTHLLEEQRGMSLKAPRWADEVRSLRYFYIYLFVLNILKLVVRRFSKRV